MADRACPVAALILAAGRARRFGAGPGPSKVFALLEGKALVAHVVAIARASGVAPVIVVTGHAAASMPAALRENPPDLLVSNPDYATGMASSLRVGLDALPTTTAGVLVLLADMPLVAPATLTALMDTFAARIDRGEACAAVVPEYRGTRGNPVLLGRTLFVAARRLTGDEGARRLLSAHASEVVVQAVDDPGILADVDTMAALDAIRRR